MSKFLWYKFWGSPFHKQDWPNKLLHITHPMISSCISLSFSLSPHTTSKLQQELNFLKLISESCITKQCNQRWSSARRSGSLDVFYNGSGSHLHSQNTAKIYVQHWDDLHGKFMFKKGAPFYLVVYEAACKSVISKFSRLQWGNARLALPFCLLFDGPPFLYVTMI